MIFGFETNFSDEALKEIFLYRGAVITRKKSATIISAEKYHKLVLKNNSDNFFDASPSKNNDKKVNDFKDLMMKRMQEIQGSGDIEDKGFDLPDKSGTDDIWNEEKLADQENAHYDDEMDQQLDKIINRKRSSTNMSQKK